MRKPWFRRSDYRILFPIPFSTTGWIIWIITMILGIMLIVLSQFFLLIVLMIIYSAVAYFTIDS
jgi:hypothetical protein